MKSLFLSFLLAISFMSFGQRQPVIDANTTTTGIQPGLATMAYRNDSLWIIKPSGKTQIATVNTLNSAIASVNSSLNSKVNIGSIGSNYIAMYDASNKSIYSSNIYKANSRIGINTTNPTHGLHVNGDARFTSILARSRIDIEGTQIFGDINGNLAGVTFGNWTNPSGGYVLEGGGGSVGDWNMDDPYIYLRGNKGVAISTGSDNFGNTAGIFVDTLRNVGIKTTEPLYTLDVSGTMRSTSSAYFATTSGGVGIGTESPLGTLHLVSGLPDPFFIEQTSDTGYAQIIYKGTSRRFQTGVGGGSEVAVGVADKFFVYDATAGFVRVVIDQSGNFGINTTAPSTTLDVNGTMKITPVSAAVAEAYPPLEGRIVIVNTTNATFTSLGLWSYAAGAWRK